MASALMRSLLLGAVAVGATQSRVDANEVAYVAPGFEAEPAEHLAENSQSRRLQTYPPPPTPPNPAVHNEAACINRASRQPDFYTAVLTTAADRSLRDYCQGFNCAQNLADYPAAAAYTDLRCPDPATSIDYIGRQTLSVPLGRQCVLSGVVSGTQVSRTISCTDSTQVSNWQFPLPDPPVPQAPADICRRVPRYPVRFVGGGRLSTVTIPNGQMRPFIPASPNVYAVFCDVGYYRRNSTPFATRYNRLDCSVGPEQSPRPECVRNGCIADLPASRLSVEETTVVATLSDASLRTQWQLNRAEFQCHPGYTIQGRPNIDVQMQWSSFGGQGALDNTRTEINCGQETIAYPTCVQHGCYRFFESFPAVTGGELLIRNEREIFLNCDRGYYSVGDTVFDCDNGRQPTFPTCRRNDCYGAQQYNSWWVYPDGMYIRLPDGSNRMRVFCNNPLATVRGLGLLNREREVTVNCDAYSGRNWETESITCEV